MNDIDDNDNFKEGIMDVFDSEILYNMDGNIAEKDLGKRLKKIMKYHMSKLWKRLDIFTVLASSL